MSRILLEDNHGPFIVDRTKIVTESVGGIDFTNVPGRLSTIGVVNGNKRRYGKSVWEKNLADNSVLRTLMGRNASFGLLEHPKTGEVDLNSPIAVVLTEARIEGNDIVGAFRILNTAEGNKLKALIEAGFNPTVSSRGFGSLVRAADGIDEVQDDYICEGWDVVLKPSFSNAVLTPGAVEVKKAANESATFSGCIETEKGVSIHSTAFPSIDEARQWVRSISENFTSQKVKSHIRKSDGTLLEFLSTSAAPAAPVAPSVLPKVTESVSKTSTEKPTVDITTIKNQIAEMRTTVASKLPPQRFSEGMTRLNDLHVAVASYVSEDAKRSWEGHKLHDEIAQIEANWNAAAAAPTKEAARLKENYTKLLKVAKALAETCTAYRSKAVTAVSTLNKTQNALKEAVKRGRGWVERAKNAENIDENVNYKVVCEALRKVVAQHKELKAAYNEDVTDLGRTMLATEFADKLKDDEELTKQLEEAKTPDDLVAVREAITGIKEDEDDESKATEELPDPKADDKKGDKAPVTEKKGLPAFLKKEKKKGDKKEDASPGGDKAKLAKKVGESKTPEVPASTGVTIVKNFRDPKNVEESIEMVGRLSKSSNQLVG